MFVLSMSVCASHENRSRWSVFGAGSHPDSQDTCSFQNKLYSASVHTHKDFFSDYRSF